MTDYNNKLDLRRCDFNGQKVAFAKSKKSGDTTFEVDKIVFKAGTFPPPQGSDEVGYYPKIEQADVHLPAVRQLSNPGNADAPVPIKYFDGYVNADFGNGDVFAQLVNPTAMKFSHDKSLGVGAPNLNVVGLSRRFGPVGGDPGNIAGTLGTFAGGAVQPAQFFDTSAKVLGAIKLSDLIADLAPGDVTDANVLRVKTDTSDPQAVKTFLDWTPKIKANPVLVFRNDPPGWAAAPRPACRGHSPARPPGAEEQHDRRHTERVPSQSCRRRQAELP